MTRYKKEMQKHGYMLECDFPYLPYCNCGEVIEGITTFIRGGYIHQKIYYTSLVVVNVIDKRFNVINQEWH